jgi:tRNA-dihydrouridine synthase
MGCPVRKVCKTGAGASLLDDQDKAVALARGAVEGGGGIPVMVKVRSGQRPGERTGLDLARRLVEEAGVAAIGFHPRHASQQHKGKPDYDLAAELARTLGAPVILSGGMSDEAAIRQAFERTGVDAVMLARGSLGMPWRFERLLGLRDGEPTRAEIVAELDWVIGRAEEHLGVERASRYLRKFYPWYADALELTKRERQPLVTADTTDDARAAAAALLESGATPLAA